MQAPSPILNKRETQELEKLKFRYGKLTSPSAVAKIGKKISISLPVQIKEVGKAATSAITEQELYAQAMKVVVEGFKILEQNAAKTSLSEKQILKNINKQKKHYDLEELQEICLVRGYDISKVVADYKLQDLGIAFVEGSATGAFGFAGLPFNLVLSTFIYYRAVQSIAMCYGYDVKNDPAELVIASDVFMNALSPSQSDNNELTNIIAKIMIMSESTAVKQTVKKTWTDMAARGGASLLITQMRALANKAAQKALHNAGKKGLENSIFKNVFEQLGKKLTQKAVARAIPVVSAVIGALFDTAQMHRVLEYADVFYNKRFLLEKEVRINLLFEESDTIIDVEEVKNGEPSTIP